MACLKNKIAIFLRFTLLILFVSYYSGVTLFYHAHMINGQVIVHSHPYRPSGNGQNSQQTHNHSKAAYVLIHQLNQICWESFHYVPQIPDPVVILCAYQSDYKSSFVPFNSFPGLFLRAPPAFFA